MTSKALLGEQIGRSWFIGQNGGWGHRSRGADFSFTKFSAEGKGRGKTVSYVAFLWHLAMLMAFFLPRGDGGWVGRERKKMLWRWELLERWSSTSQWSKVLGQMEGMGPKAWANDESRNTLLLGAYTLWTGYVFLEYWPHYHYVPPFFIPDDFSCFEIYPVWN